MSSNIEKKLFTADMGQLHFFTITVTSCACLDLAWSVSLCVCHTGELCKDD